MDEKTAKQILEALEKILRVVSLQVGADKSITERVNLLKLAGLDNKTIASVLNTTDATVRAISSDTKRKPKKK